MWHYSRVLEEPYDGLADTSGLKVEGQGVVDGLLRRFGTIREEEDLGGESLYRLGYPNREVRQSLNRSLLDYMVREGSRPTEHRIRLYRLLQANDFAGMEALFHAFCASIRHEWYTHNDIACYEGFCASVFYSYIAALGLDITVEDSTSHGRLDMAVTPSEAYTSRFRPSSSARVLREVISSTKSGSARPARRPYRPTVHAPWLGRAPNFTSASTDSERFEVGHNPRRPSRATAWCPVGCCRLSPTSQGAAADTLVLSGR